MGLNLLKKMVEVQQLLKNNPNFGFQSLMVK
jgi:hypothetical protein